MSVRTCPMCGSGNAATSTQCWVCGATLGTGDYAPVPASVQKSGDTMQALGWLGLLTGIAFVTVLIGIELALEWPGLLVPYALVVVIGFAALTRTAWLQTRKGAGQPQGSPQPTAASSPGASKGDGSKLVQDVALGLSIALLVIAAFALLMVAAVVIFFIICLAVIAGAGGLH